MDQHKPKSKLKLKQFVLSLGLKIIDNKEIESEVEDGEIYKVKRKDSDQIYAMMVISNCNKV